MRVSAVVKQWPVSPPLLLQVEEVHMLLIVDAAWHDDGQILVVSDCKELIVSLQRWQLSKIRLTLAHLLDLEGFDYIQHRLKYDQRVIVLDHARAVAQVETHATRQVDLGRKLIHFWVERKDSVLPLVKHRVDKVAGVSGCDWLNHCSATFFWRGERLQQYSQFEKAQVQMLILRWFLRVICCLVDLLKWMHVRSDNL